jgi:5-methylcytosine-specific restriction endonuclease McrA
MVAVPLEHPAPEARAMLLHRAVELRELACQAEREHFIAVAAYADAHTTGALLPDLYGTYSLPDEDAYDRAEDAWVERFGMIGADRMLDLAGPGAPEVSEFAVVELAAALGRSTDAGRKLVADAVEAKHRLPQVWARLEAGQVEVWRVRRLTDHTRALTLEVAGFVDAHLAHVIHTAGPATIARCVTEAIARFDPETTEIAECDTTAGLHLHLGLADDATSVGTAGAVSIDGSLDRADAEELEAVIRDLAEQLRLAQDASGGPVDTLDVRRAKAMGYLARGQQPCPDPASAGPATDPAAGPAVGTGAADQPLLGAGRRQVVLHVHLSAAALAGTEPGSPEVDPTSGRLGIHLARVENHRTTLTADTVRTWCGTPGTQVTVKPVIDLAETVSVEAYEIPDRLAARVRYQRPTCAFPHCGRPARAADLDHTVEYVPPDQGGPPGQTSTDNLAPLCRTHHRAKTHPSPTGLPSQTRWRYQRLTPGTWLWTSPRQRRYLVHPDGTTTL